MDMKKRENLKKWKYGLLLLLAAALMEVLIGNFAFWKTLGYRQTEVKDPYILSGTGEEGNDAALTQDTSFRKDFGDSGMGLPYQYGTAFALSADEKAEGQLLILTEPVKLRNIYVETSFPDRENDADGGTGEEYATLSVSVIDEGRAHLFPMTEKLVTPAVPRSQYLSLEPFGRVSQIAVSVHGPAGVSVSRIMLNANVPFHFSPVRFLLYLCIVLTICAVVMVPRKTLTGRKAFLVYLPAVMLLILVLAGFLYEARLQPDTAGKGYADLAEAFLSHRLYVEKNEDPVLESLPNPYDERLRESAGAFGEWDTAYYRGYYYIYFGVVPAVLFFVPYRMITGSSLSYYAVELLLVVLIIPGCFTLLYALEKRFFDRKRLPEAARLLLYCAFSLGIGTVIMIKRTQIYYVAIGTGLALTVWGLALWLHSAPRLQDGDRHSIAEAMAGSFLLALAVGCRPQFALAGFLVFPVFSGVFTNFPGRGGQWGRRFLLIFPYIPVAAVLMWYNNARFGSPFDFGANYNMTSYDMTHMGVHLSRLWDGFWNYLLSWSPMMPHFPYLVGTDLNTVYPGFMFAETQIGGIFFLVPLLWILFLPFPHTGKDLPAGMKERFGLLWRLHFSDAQVLRLMTGLCVLLGMVAVAADTILCGICTRYQMDFRIFFLMAAVLKILILYTAAQPDAGERIQKDSGEPANGFIESGSLGVIRMSAFLRIVMILSALTILMSILTLCAGYETQDYQSINPTFYCSLRYWIGLQ